MLVAALSAFVLVTLAACGGEDPSPTPSREATSSAAAMGADAGVTAQNVGFKKFSDDDAEQSPATVAE